MKVKTIFILIVFSGISEIKIGQVKDSEKTLRTQTSDTLNGWKSGGVFGFTMSQTSLTNWIAGGQNSLSLNGLFSGFANYKKGKSAWDNTLDIGYGLLRQGKGEDFRKTDDRIDFLSKYGRELFRNVYYSALMNFKTQITPGYNYPDVRNKISDLFSPAYLVLALGIDYKPEPSLSIFAAPLTGKFTIVTDQELSDQGAFGVDPGETTRSEIGGYLRIGYSKNDFNAELLKNVTFTTRIDLFSNYAENPRNVDVSWETLLTMKVNKFLSVNLNTHLIYDDNILIPWDRNDNGSVETGEGVKSKIQFKEIFGVGLSYKF